MPCKKADDLFKQFEGKEMTIIHMYLPDYDIDRQRNFKNFGQNDN